MTPHDCAQIEELLSARMDGATSPEEDARIERHLRDCADCQATALAFTRVNREVGAYLRATPVPAIGTPWRGTRRAPLLVQGLLARWRPTTLALTTILVLIVASVVAFGAFRGNTGRTEQTSAPQSAYTTSGAAPSTAASAAPRAAASTAPTAAAAVPSAAPSTAPPAAPVLAPSVGARATVPSGGSAGAASSAPSAAPHDTANGAAGSYPVYLNLVQTLNLNTATSVAICRPDCTVSPRGAETFSRILPLLDAYLPLVSPPAQADSWSITLRFALADGQQVELRYDPSTDRLRLPSGQVVLAPKALGEALTPPKPLP